MTGTPGAQMLQCIVPNSCSCHFMSSGLTAETQGWHLKRLLTFTKNRLANRPHKPRDPMLRQLMADLGFTWPDDESAAEDGESSDDDGSSSDSTSDEDDGNEMEKEHDGDHDGPTG